MVKMSNTDVLKTSDPRVLADFIQTKLIGYQFLVVGSVNAVITRVLNLRRTNTEVNFFGSSIEQELDYLLYCGTSDNRIVDQYDSLVFKEVWE